VQINATPGKAGERLRVVAVATFPVEAAATRFRVEQFIAPLRDCGIDVTLLPFLTNGTYRDLYDRTKAGRTALRLIAATCRRVLHLRKIVSADVLFVQREAMLFGPPWVEWLASRVARVPLVLDLDDATWMPQPNAVYPSARFLKPLSKTDHLVRWSKAVIGGSEAIAEHARALQKHSVVIGTAVDPDVFTPRDPDPGGEIPVIGWIGTHSTWSYVEPMLPVLEDLATRYRFRFRVVGSGRPSIAIPGVEVENLPWEAAREVADFQSLDIGIYPLPDDEWASAKSGLKAAQYLACGVPYVAAPVGILRNIGEEGVTHYSAATLDEWRNALERLLRSKEERRVMGAAGRRYAVEHYRIAEIAAQIAGVFRTAADRRDGEGDA
jgi:glycosyltransferase involved in cell wall biosynthesis